jgi:hypothetical protein
MKLYALVLLFACPASISAQTSPQDPNPWKELNFLKGTWEAKTAAGATAKITGTYTFQMELKGHVLARHATVSDCTGPETFDCQHGDLFYVYQDSTENGLKAIYFDNEGHVIKYAVSTTEPSTVTFMSEPQPGPRFRLVYHLDGAVMYGRFQIQMPAQDTWTSYLEWSGSKR